MSSKAPKSQHPTITTFVEFETNFKYQGDHLYSLIFERNKDSIKVSKEKFAIRNLQKIFDATFLITPKVGFEAMSLRDLSTETGLSMGGLYSSISSKESIAIMVKDVVAIICGEVVESARSQENTDDALQNLIRGYLYAATLMQPWFNFLYFETKSLPHSEQEESKNIELDQVSVLADLLERLKTDADTDSDFIASMALSLIQERYLKPWKYPQPSATVDQYADDCLALIYKLIDYKKT